MGVGGLAPNQALWREGGANRQCPGSIWKGHGGVCEPTHGCSPGAHTCQQYTSAHAQAHMQGSTLTWKHMT